MPLLGGLTGCFLAVIVVGCSPRTANRKNRDEDAKLPRLEVVQPQLTSLDVASDLTATVEAFEKAELCAQVRGVVNPIAPDIDIGRAVKKDEVLLTLAIPDLLADKEYKAALEAQAEKVKEQAEQNREVARAEVVEAEAQEQRYRSDLLFKELQHKRIVELSKRETVQPQLSEETRMVRDAAQSALAASLAQVRTKKARLKAADGDIEVAKSRIKAAQAAVAQASAQIDFGKIKAPFDGVITKRWVDGGASVKDSGMPLLSVMRSDRVRVILDVPERDVPYLGAAGNTNSALSANRVSLRVPALRDAVFDGEVTLVSGALDPATRTMRVEVHLDNSSGQLRPQMTGTARLILARRERVMTVPSSALVRSSDAVEVYYLDKLHGNPPRGVVKRAAVKLGLDDGLRVEIQSGLNGQERVVTKGNGVVRIGDTAIAADAAVIELR
jgi:HlyD family secretion protein